MQYTDVGVSVVCACQKLIDSGARPNSHGCVHDTRSRRTFSDNINWQMTIMVTAACCRRYLGHFPPVYSEIFFSKTISNDQPMIKVFNRILSTVKNSKLATSIKWTIIEFSIYHLIDTGQYNQIKIYCVPYNKNKSKQN